LPLLLTASHVPLLVLSLAAAAAAVPPFGRGGGGGGAINHYSLSSFHGLSGPSLARADSALLRDGKALTVRHRKYEVPMLCEIFLGQYVAATLLLSTTHKCTYITRADTCMTGVVSY
jgi:hypothetical protein